MSLTVELPEEVQRRLQAEAARRGLAVESLIAETLERDSPPLAAVSPMTSYIGSFTAREDLAENYKQIRRELSAGRPSEA